MKNQKAEIWFWAFTAIFSLLIFLANSNHISQQSIYYDTILPLAKSMLSAHGYSDSSGNPVFYPLWGYPIMQIAGFAIGRPVALTLLLQFVFSLLAIVCFYRIFKIEKKYYHIPLFLPFLALMSVKVPDAMVAFLLLPYIYFAREYIENRRVGSAVMAGAVLAICVNFRSEYLFLPLAHFLMIFLVREKRNETLKLSLIIIIAVLLGLLPWSLRSLNATGEYMLTATNGGSVAYISLGQLDGNKWGIAPFDSTAVSVAQLNGFDTPFSPAADKMFKDKFFQAISDEPIEFIKKALSNSSKIFYRGVYTGEFANIFITSDRRAGINNYLLSKGGTLSQMMALKDLPASESVPIAIEKAIQLLFMAVLLVMFVMIIAKCFSKKNLSNPTFALILSLIIYRIVTIAAVQYEYRHVTSFYILILGISLTAIKNKLK